MTVPAGTCQTPSREVGRVGFSGIDPPKFGESVFVADQADALDVSHAVNAANPVVTACIQTTRCVGAVDDEGFLRDVDFRVERGFLTGTLVLTVRGAMGGVDVGGLLGKDRLDVEVVLHRGSAHPVSLGRMEGGFFNTWENYRLDVPIGAVKFPADPCPNLGATQTCGLECVPRPNEVSFVFSGSALPPGNSRGMSFSIDWLSLEPKAGLELASRPILFVHGWTGSSLSWEDSAWTDTVLFEGVPFHVIEIPPDGRVASNGALVTAAVQDLARRLGVERIAIVAHSKGGVDSREHVRAHDDVEVLIMIGTPNAGTPLASAAALRPFADGVRDMTPEAMRNYNVRYFQNFGTTYVTVSGQYDSPKARRLAIVVGPNDEVIHVASVHALPYATPFEYATSVSNVESQGICAGKRLTNHSCLLYRQTIVDDLLPAFLSLTGPSGPPAEERGQGSRIVTSGAAVSGEPEVFGQVIMSEAGVAASGVTGAHAVVVDPVDAVTFLVMADPATVTVALVSPAGARIDATTQDPGVTRLSAGDLGPMCYTGFDVQSPQAGTWSVEVTGTAATTQTLARSAVADQAEPPGYVVSAMTPLVPGVGVVLEARTDQTLLGTGQPVTVVATLTQDGQPITDAAVGAVVVHPDGAARTELALLDDGADGDAVAGDGVYTAVFTDTTVAGAYDIQVSAARSEPAFTREQSLQPVVLPSGTTFSGPVADRGVDIDGDGLFDQLVVDVGLTVDTAATYRLYGTLTEAASAAVIEQVRPELPLEPGAQSVALVFSGARLFDARLDGPYVLTDLALEDTETATVVALGEPHTTGPYAHTEFQRPVCVLTGNTSDHGDNAADKPLPPYEELVVEVEVDLLAAADIDAGARLRGSDGSLIHVAAFSTQSPAGPSMLSFRFEALRIFPSGLSGPYTLQELTLSGTTDASDPGAAFSLTVPGAVAVTQAYALEDFAPSPSFTVGGTVTGLVGSGLILETESQGSTDSLRITGNGAFTFAFPRLFGGNSYEVRVKTQPSNPAQACGVVNGSGVIADEDVTDVQVQCPPPAAVAGT